MSTGGLSETARPGQGQARVAAPLALAMARSGQWQARVAAPLALRMARSGQWQARAVPLTRRMAPCAQHRARVAVPLALRAGLSSERQARASPLKWPSPATWAGVPDSGVRTHPLAGPPLDLPNPRPLRRPASLARWKRTSSLRTGDAQSARARGPRNRRGRCPTATATGRRRLSRRCASNEPRRRRCACRFHAARYAGPDRRSSSGTRRRPTGGLRPPPREQALGA